MKGLFGLVSVLLALLVVGWLATRQLKAVGPMTDTATAGTAAPASATVRAQARQLEGKVSGDVAKALEQGAARQAEADK